MTKRIFLIGHPLGHSISPVFQQAALDHYSLDVLYKTMDIEAPSLPQAVRLLRHEDVLGANVTVPHKEAIVPLLDSLEKEARLIGAVNTIVNREHSLEGRNTDALGFLRALKREADFDPRGKAVLILGAGGAARAVAFALAQHGVESVVIANRTVERAKALAELVRPRVSFAGAIPLNPTVLAPTASRSHLIVNCTSMGMQGGPAEKETPLKADLIPSHCLVCDLVYNPPETPLLREAARTGAHTMGGLPMLVHQGAASFELWTSLEPPLEVMFKAAEKAIDRKPPM